MTFREKWAVDHPESIPCTETCPHHVGYEVNKCYRCGEEGFRCDMCWDREMPETEEAAGDKGEEGDCGLKNACKHVAKMPDLNALIERAGTKKDISLTIFISGDHTHISIYPCPDPSEKKGNPVAEAYKLLVESGYKTVAMERAIDYLGEALKNG